MKRTLSILMTLLLLWSLALPAAAAETATAATLRLEKTEGTVNVSNASGKSVTVTDGMRLYSGYTITTEKSSYAYVSLDSTKAVKLDASSKVEVQKSGKKLELSLISGELFFNVTAPLEKDENLNIRTSTMVTGVRGTSGWVTVINRFTSSIHLLEGTLTVTSAEPVTGQMRQVTITGGQTATATLTGLAQAGSQMSLTVTNLQEKQVPGFVAVEVEKDPVLQQKITAKSPLSVPSIIGDAWARLENEQASANAADQKIQQDLNKIAADEVDQVFQSPVEDDDDDDDDDTPPTESETPPTESETPPTESETLTSITLDDPSADELTQALEQNGVDEIIVNAGTKSTDAAIGLGTASYEVSAGQTLTLASGTFTVGSGQMLTVASGGALAVTRGSDDAVTTLQIEGTANIYGSATNSDSITITSTKSLHVLSGGSLTNTGTIQVGDETADGLLQVESGGTLNNNSGGSISIVAGSVTNAGTFTNSGVFAVDGPGLFTSTGDYYENRTNLYAMAQNKNSGQVSYLGLAVDMSGWYSGTIVTLIGAAEQGTIEAIPSVTADGELLDVTLDLNGKAVTLGSTLTVGAGGKLTIQDSKSTGSLTASSDAITVSDGGTLTMNGGEVTSEIGTAILLIDGALTLGNADSDGTDSGCTVSGGAIGIDISGGSLTMKNGQVSGGIGINMINENENISSISISGGSVKGNSCGIYANCAGVDTFNISGGTISGGADGTGIQLTSGRLTLGNADSDGTGSGCTVSGKTGIDVSGGLFMKNGQVSGDTGINVTADGDAQITGGSVNGNTNGIKIAPIPEVVEFSPVVISGTAVITLTEEPNEDDTLSGCAVSGSFTFSGGALRAKQNVDNVFYDTQPYASVTVSDNTDSEGYYTATPVS